MTYRANSLSRFIKGATGKPVIAGVLIANLLKIIFALFKGMNATDAISVTVITVTLAIFIHILCHKVIFRS